MYVIQLMNHDTGSGSCASHLKSARLVHCAMTLGRMDIWFTTYLYRHVSVYGLVQFHDTG